MLTLFLDEPLPGVGSMNKTKLVEEVKGKWEEIRHNLGLTSMADGDVNNIGSLLDGAQKNSNPDDPAGGGVTTPTASGLL